MWPLRAYLIQWKICVFIMLAFIHSFEILEIKLKIYSRKRLSRHIGPYVTLYDLWGQTSCYEKVFMLSLIQNFEKIRFGQTKNI